VSRGIRLVDSTLVFPREPLPGAGHADVTEAAFFFHFTGFGGEADGTGVRDQAVFHADHGDEGELEAIGGMERHNLDLGVLPDRLGGVSQREHCGGEQFFETPSCCTISRNGCDLLSKCDRRW
jgi:hypothetical protein